MSDAERIGVYNEWGKLREVVVGYVPDRVIIPSLSYSMMNYLNEPTKELMRQYQGYDAWKLDSELVKMVKAVRDELDGLAKLYEKHGIKVHRARAWEAQEEGYLACTQPGGWMVYARDPVLVVGKNVIELAIVSPNRRKEIFAIRDILNKCLAEDPKAQYVSLPVPPPYPITGIAPEGPGPFLEGGDIFVMGSDVLVGISGLASSLDGIEWLERYLSPQGYRVYTVPLTGEWLHLDCVFAVIKPGLAMLCREALAELHLPAPFNEWDFIEVLPEEAHALGCNIMCLKENDIVIGSEHQRLIRELEKKGVEVKTTPMANASAWGGGIRCSTHPILRDK